MRQSVCKVVPCHDQSLPASQRYVEVQLLTGDSLNFIVDAKSTGQELFNQVCDSLKLNDAKLFGIALLIDGDFHFLDLSLKVSKYVPKIWKVINENDLNRTGIPSIVFQFRVQFYIDCYLLIRDRIARHHYYLQLRENVIRYGQTLSEEKAFLLAALALQADWGNYNAKIHSCTYFDPKKYFPKRVISKMGYDYITEHTPSLHKDNFGLSRSEAELLFIKESSDSNSAHNVHLYKLSKKKNIDSHVIWLGISFRGIHFFEEISSSTKRHISLFHWADISKLYFDKKKFEIRSGGCPEPRKFTYYTTSDELAKNLFWLCRATHQFGMFIEPQVKELEKRDSTINKNYREAYIYSSCRELPVGERKRNYHLSNTIDRVSSSGFKKEGSRGSDHCISIISNASSNTTSGIVSDKIQSLDESEDDLELDFIAPLPSSQLPVSSKDHVALLESTSPKHHEVSVSSSSSGLNCADVNNSIECKRSRWHSEPAYFRNSDADHGGDAYFSSLSDVTKLSRVCAETNANLRKYKCEDLHCCDKLYSDLQLSDKFAKTDILMYPRHLCRQSQDEYNKWHVRMCSKSAGCIHSEKSSHSVLNLHYQSGSSDHNSLYKSKVKHLASCQDVSNCDSKLPRIPLCFSSRGPFFPGHYHSRTATKIGVSSLTRLHGFPNNYFGSGAISTASSEPSLCNSAACYNYANGMEVHPQMSSLPVIQKVNDCKNLLGNYNNVLSARTSSDCSKSFVKHLWESNPCLSSSHYKDSATMSVPPSASASWFNIEHTQKSGGTNFENEGLSHEFQLRLGSLPTLPSSNGDFLAFNNIPASTLSSSLDFHQLHHKSGDVELPLMSALYNDRSLLMFPKTVPTCTWQRHMGKDLRRFSCSAVFSPSYEKYLYGERLSVENKQAACHLNTQHKKPLVCANNLTSKVDSSENRFYSHLSHADKCNTKCITSSNISMSSL